MPEEGEHYFNNNYMIKELFMQFCKWAELTIFKSLIHVYENHKIKM